MEKLIQEALDSTYPGHGLHLGICLKQLWSGTKKTKLTTTKQASTPPNHHPPGLCVVHIDSEWDHETTTKAMIGAVLCLPSFSSYSNLPLCLVDVLCFNSSEEEKESFASAYKGQSNISASLSWATYQDIINLDSPIFSAPYNGASLCHLILQMKTSKGQPIFMSINWNWNRSGHVFSFPSLYHWEAQHCVSYMAKYLAEEYSPHIYAHFSTAAVAIVESMEWDAVLQKPISANESLHWDIENITFSWEISDHSPPPPWPPIP